VGRDFARPGYDRAPPYAAELTVRWGVKSCIAKITRQHTGTVLPRLGPFVCEPQKDTEAPNPGDGAAPPQTRTDSQSPAPVTAAPPAKNSPTVAALPEAAHNVPAEKTSGTVPSNPAAAPPSSFQSVNNAKPPAAAGTHYNARHLVHRARTMARRMLLRKEPSQQPADTAVAPDAPDSSTSQRSAK